MWIGHGNDGCTQGTRDDRSFRSMFGDAVAAGLRAKAEHAGQPGTHAANSRGERACIGVAWAARYGHPDLAADTALRSQESGSSRGPRTRLPPERIAEGVGRGA